MGLNVAILPVVNKDLPISPNTDVATKVGLLCQCERLVLCHAECSVRFVKLYLYWYIFIFGVLFFISFFFFFFISLLADGPQRSHPASGHSRIFPSLPGLRLTIFYRDASQHSHNLQAQYGGCLATCNGGLACFTESVQRLKVRMYVQ